MAKAELSSLAAAWLAAGLSGSVLAAEVRAKAEVACRPAENKLQYDCTIKLTNARSNEPLAGLALSVGADMPSMPGAHNVRPVKATEGQEGGTYQARIALEMYGDWAVRLDLAGKVRDRIVKVLRFDAEGAREAPPRAPLPRHKH